MLAGRQVAVGTGADQMATTWKISQAALSLFLWVYVLIV